MRSICSRGKHTPVPALKLKQPQNVDLKTICRFLSNQPDFSDASRADWFPVKSIGDVNCLVLLKIRPTLQECSQGPEMPDYAPFEVWASIHSTAPAVRKRVSQHAHSRRGWKRNPPCDNQTGDRNLCFFSPPFKLDVPNLQLGNGKNPFIDAEAHCQMPQHIVRCRMLHNADTKEWELEFAGK